METIKIAKRGRFQDKPYQPQFNIEPGEEIELGDTTVVGDDEKATCLSRSIASTMAGAGYGEISTAKDDASDGELSEEEKAEAKTKAEAEEAKVKKESDKAGDDKADAEGAGAEPKSEADQAEKDKSASGEAGPTKGKGKGH